ADTLLQANPQHLLGLVLASRVADLEQDEARRATYARRLLEAAPAELDQGRPAYAVHANTINIALTEARRRARSPDPGRPAVTAPPPVRRSGGARPGRPTLAGRPPASAPYRPPVASAARRVSTRHASPASRRPARCLSPPHRWP